MEDVVIFVFFGQKRQGHLAKRNTDDVARLSLVQHDGWRSVGILNIRPLQFTDVTDAESGEAGEDKGSLRLFALGFHFHEAFHLVHREIFSCRLYASLLPAKPTTFLYVLLAP